MGGTHAVDPAEAGPRRRQDHAQAKAIYWIVTAVFCLQMSFTAYAQLRLPQVAEAFRHLGFPDYFRVERRRLQATPTSA